MKLNIIKTNTTSEGSNGLISRLAYQKNSGNAHFFIVPDRLTLSFEQEICEKVFPDGFYNVDVVSFTRLAIKLLGGKIKKNLSKEGTVILLNKIIRENNDKLVYYKNLKSYSFSRELFAAIASLRDNGISSANIESSLENFSGHTKEKLKDIQLLYKEYMAELEKYHSDTITRIDSLIKNVHNLPILHQSHIYIYGFNVYSGQQMSLIKELIKYCKSVSIAFAADSGGINFPYFITHQMEEFKNFCFYENIPCEVEERTCLLTSPFDLIHKNIFGYGKKSFKLENENKSKLVLFSYENPYDEINGAAKEIVHLVRNHGYRYKDIALVICSDGYKKIIQEVFTRCDIPYYTDSKQYVKDGFASTYINSLFECICDNYSFDKMCKLSHHPLSNFSRKEIEEFENYSVKYSVNYNKFLQPFNTENSELAESARLKLINKLAKIPQGKNKVSSYVEYAKSELLNEDTVEILEKFMESGDTMLKGATEIKGFIDVLTEIEEILGNNLVTIEEFLNMLNSAIEDMGNVILPQYIDCIFVGNSTDSRYKDIKALFITGAGNGLFPKITGDNVIITAFDNEVMKRGGFKIYPDPIEKNSIERFAIIDLLSKPSEKLYIGYSKTDIAGESISQGEVLNELSHLFDIKEFGIIESIHNFDDSQKLIYNLINSKNAYYQYIKHNIPEKYREVTREYLVNNNYSAHIYNNEKNIDIDYSSYFFKIKDDMYNTSVSQLESYFKCPYFHFLRYGLKIKEREEGFIKANIIGDIIHRMLEFYFKNYYPAMLKADGERIQYYINNTVENIINLPDFDIYRNEGMGRYTLSNLVDEGKKLLSVMTQNVKNSNFAPSYLEMEFGRGEGKRLVIQSADKKFNFTGKVDRVDTCGNKVAVIDYKTGTVEDALKYVYFGKKIQLYLYLKVFINEGMQPAGVFYMPIKSNYSKDGITYKMEGQIVDDISTFALLDKNFTGENEYQSDMVNFEIKTVRDKLKISGKNSKNSISEQDFMVITDYAIEISKIALNEICTGYKDKNPLEGNCEWCPYKNMCGDIEQRKTIGVDGVKSFYLKKEENFDDSNA